MKMMLFLAFTLIMLSALSMAGIPYLKTLHLLVCFRHEAEFSDRLLGSFLDDSSKIIRFFNPRRGKWLDHFKIDNLQINAITEIGKVTLKILKLNDEHRVLERELLLKTGFFPFARAKKLIGFSDT
jgi:hypothetical protein